MTHEVLIRTLALILAVCGIYLLQAAWHSKRSSLKHWCGGWALLLASTILWALTSGADKGAALGIIAVVLIALGFIGRNALRAGQRPARETSDRETERQKTSVLTVLRRIWIGLLIGPLSGLAALALSTAAFAILKRMTVEHTINLTIVSFGFVLLWSCIAVFAGFEKRPLRAGAGVIGAGIAPLAYLVFLG